jgi:hypothetical protein
LRRRSGKVLRFARLQYVSPKSGVLAHAGVVRGDGAVVVADGLEHVAEPEPRAEMRRRSSRQRRRLDRPCVNERASQGAGTQEMGLRLRRLEREHAVEAVERSL